MKTSLRNILVLSVIGSCFITNVASAQGGVPLWTNFYNGSSNGDDRASAIALDHSGNVYVTGSSRGDFNNDYATVKYSSEGVPLWTNLYIGPNNGSGNPFGGDIPASVAVDTDGNVYVTGQSDSPANKPNYATVKYSSLGLPLWTNRYVGPGGNDVASCVSVDETGNAYVTGSSDSSPVGGLPDFATIKYSSAGARLWTNRYNGPANGVDSAYRVTIDSSGNVYVTGQSTGSGSGQDYATIKYSAAGAPLWTNRYNGSANGRDIGWALALDGDGNVFVTGVSHATGSSNNFLTIKYSSGGIPLWTNQYDGPGNGDDGPLAMVVDGSGNVYVTGYSTGSGTSYDYATIAYSNAGVPLWTNRYNGPDNGIDMPRSVGVDGSGNVFVTGGGSLESGNTAYVTIAYSNSGAPLWTNRHSGIAYGLVVDGSGSVYVTGASYQNGMANDFGTIKYAPTVSLQIEPIAGDAVLIWGNASFGLQSAPSATGAFTNVTGATSPYTNHISGEQQFFRLKAN